MGATERLTLTGVRDKLMAQTSLFLPEDLIPVPCNPDALAMGYAIKTPAGLQALTRFLPPEALLAGAAQHHRVRERRPAQGAGLPTVLDRSFARESGELPVIAAVLPAAGSGAAVARLQPCLSRVDHGVHGCGEFRRSRHEEVLRTHRAAGRADHSLRSVSTCLYRDRAELLERRRAEFEAMHAGRVISIHSPTEARP